MIFTVTLNPEWNKIVKVDEVVIGKVNRLSQIESEPGGKGINVARTIKTLDIPCIATGFLGGSGGNLILVCCKGKKLSAIWCILSEILVPILKLLMERIK